MATQSSILAGESHGQRSLTFYSPWITRVRHDLVTKPPLNQFQVYNKVIQLYIYMYLFSFKFFPHLGYCKELSQVPCAMQQVFICYLFFFFQILKLIFIYFSLKQLYFPHFSIQVFDFSLLIYLYGFLFVFCFFKLGVITLQCVRFCCTTTKIFNRLGWTHQLFSLNTPYISLPSTS